jgi:hypothetical protein
MNSQRLGLLEIHLNRYQFIWRGHLFLEFGQYCPLWSLTKFILSALEKYGVITMRVQGYRESRARELNCAGGYR